MFCQYFGSIVSHPYHAVTRQETFGQSVHLLLPAAYPNLHRQQHGTPLQTEGGRGRLHWWSDEPITAIIRVECTSTESNRLKRTSSLCSFIFTSRLSREFCSADWLQRYLLAYFFGPLIEGSTDCNQKFDERTSLNGFSWLEARSRDMRSALLLGSRSNNIRKYMLTEIFSQLNRFFGLAPAEPRAMHFFGFLHQNIFSAAPLFSAWSHKLRNILKLFTKSSIE